MNVTEAVNPFTTDPVKASHFDWMNPDVKYDFAADLTGIGDRSVNKISRLQHLLYSSDLTDADIEVLYTCVHRCSFSLSLPYWSNPPF